MEALAENQHGLITRAQALECGMSRSAIQHRRERGQWHLVARGIYRLAGAPATPRQRALVAVLASGQAAVLSHTSAAGLHGLPRFKIDPLTVTLHRNGRRSLPGVRQEQSLALPLAHRSVVDGIPCTSLARTLFDLCGDVSAWRAERALDDALARRLVRVSGLMGVLIDLAEHGRSGTVLFRALLEERDDRYVAPESELEARFIELTRRHALAEPERQVDLSDSDGWIGRVDFLFRKAHIVVEVDGAAFHDGLLDRRRDAERDRRLAATGWHVLRFRWDDVLHRQAAVAHAIRFRCQLDTSQRVPTTPNGVRGGGRWL